MLHQPFNTPVQSVSLSGKSTVNPNETTVYTAVAVHATGYIWEVSGGIILSGQNTEQVTIGWGNKNTGIVKCTVQGSFNSSVSVIKQVTLQDVSGCISASGVSVTGKSSVAAYETVTYTAVNTGNVLRYQWRVQGGYIQGSASNEQVRVIWGPTGSGNLFLTVTTCNNVQVNTRKQVLIGINFADCVSVTLPEIQGNTIVQSGSVQYYSIVPLTGTNPVSYEWSVTGGTFIREPSSTDTYIGVRWNTGTTGSVTVKAFNCNNAVNVKTKTINITTSPVYSCGSTITDSYTPTSQYIYPVYNLDVSDSIGKNVFLRYDVKNRPNAFKLYENGSLLIDSGWKGVATYSGLWGSSLETETTGSIDFTPKEGAFYTLQVFAGSSQGIADDFEITLSCSDLHIISVSNQDNIYTVITTGEEPVAWELTDSNNSTVASGTF